MFLSYHLGFSQDQEIKPANPNLKQVTFRYLNNEDGLSQNSVISVAQDSMGYLWIATRSGLNRYNGNNFKYYNKQFEATAKGRGKILGKVFVDRQADLWIISSGSILEKYDRETDSFYKVKNLDSVVNIFQDSYSNLYFSHYNGQVMSVNAKTKDTTVVFNISDKDLFVHDFLEVEDSLYMTTYENVYSLSIQSYEHQKIGNNLSNRNHVLAKSKDGNIWLGTIGNGLYYKSKGDYDFHPAHEINANLPKDLYIISLHVDRFDRLWICTLKEGIFLLDLNDNTIDKLKIQKRNMYALSDSEIFCLYEDSNGVIWLGTNISGMAYYDEYLSKFNVLTSSQVPEDVNIDVVLAIATDNNQNLFFGTSNGLTIYNKVTKEMKTLTDKNSPLPTSAIDALFYDNGELWIGNGSVLNEKGGLTILNKKGELEIYNKHSENPLDINYVNQIFKDSKGQMWLGSDYGLIKFDTELGVIEKYNYEIDDINSNPINSVSCILEDKNQKLWVSTYSNGIYTVNTNTGESKMIFNQFGQIKCIAFDPRDNNLLWIGSNGGGLFLYNINSDVIQNFSVEDGLPDNVIYGILFDENNNLWLSSNSGLSKFAYFEKDDYEIDNFGINDGLQSLEFNTNAYYKDSNGILYFGGLSGVNWFKPESISKNPNLPKTNISEITVLDRPVDYSLEHVFKNDQNTMSFSFESLNFSKPEGNSFKYRLVNHDKDWVESGTNSVARYVNLPPNDYTFEVISSNYDGVWNPIPATYSFNILKPWYLSYLAKFVYLILTLLLTYGIYRYFKWRWYMRMQLELESRETARWKKLDEFKTKLYTNISHEFRTPLTLISGPIDNQLAKQELSKSDKKELTLVKQNADRLLKLVDQMLNLSMIDSGQIKLKVSEGNLSILLKQIISAFQYKANQKNIHIKSDIQSLKQVWFDKDIIEKVTSNLLSNAVKYAPKESDIIFEANKQDNMLVISVINVSNYVGKNDLSRLFQRFYQDNELSEGVGVGLALVRDLVTLSKGIIIANNIDTDKIQFTVSIPIHKDAFSDGEIVNNTIEEQNSEISEKDRGFITDKPTILVVEDEPDIRTFIMSIFRNNYNIIEATNGEIGIETAQKKLPDLIISDIMMPIQDGIELCHNIKTNELTSHIPVILLTAKVGEINEIEGIKTGADAYVTKPFSSEKLKIRVEKLIESRLQLQRHFSKTLSINPELAITSTETEFLKRLQAVLNAHITDSDFTSERFGKFMQISRTQLHRKLKAITNMTTSEFIRSQRLKLAEDLLKKSDATISEIAYQVGFNTPSYFIKCFKETYGSTPNEYLSNTL